MVQLFFLIFSLVQASNPQEQAKIELGKKLYFDPRLSKNNKISCNSCHNVHGSGTDNKPVSDGVDGKKGTRNSPTVWNSGLLTVQFWDGRAPNLEEQAKGPIVNPVEMGMKDHAEVVAKISKIKGYEKEFKEVFGDKPITIDNMVIAIAAYERTLVTSNSPYEKYMAGDKSALSAAAQRGMKLVQTVGCNSCHNGPQFNGPVTTMGQGFYMKFPLIPGSSYDAKYELSKDLGRFEATKNEADKNFWRVASWRNVELTAPYFHNGKVKTLEEAVRVMAKTQLGRDLKDAEVKDIVAFLKSLTGERPKQIDPELPKS